MPSDPIAPGMEPDPTDPYARQAQTFPRLSAEMAARLAAYGVEEGLPKGTLLFARGQRSVELLPGPRRLDRDLRPRSRRRSQRVHGSHRPAIHWRAGPVQRSPDPPFGPHRRRQPGRARRAGRLPPPGHGRAGYRRGHHAGVHPAPGRPDPPRPRRGGPDRAWPRRRHTPPAAIPGPQQLSAPTARHRPRPGRRRLPVLLRADARPAAGRDLVGTSGSCTIRRPRTSPTSWA